MTTLPVVRLILHPEPGFGMDATLRLSNTTRCFLSAQSYVNGGSQLAFGIEPLHFPYLRLQLSPTTQLSLRLPFIPLSVQKQLHLASSTTLYHHGTLLKPEAPTFLALLRALYAATRPVLELRHRATLTGTLLDDRQRRALRDIASEMRERVMAAERAGVTDGLQRRRQRALQRWRELPSVDPRHEQPVRRREPLERPVHPRARGTVREMVERARRAERLRREGLGREGAGEGALEGEDGKPDTDVGEGERGADDGARTHGSGGVIGGGRKGAFNTGPGWGMPQGRMFLAEAFAQ